MTSEIKEQMQKLNRITFLESFISNNDTIEALNEAIDTPPTTLYNSAEEMTNAILGTGGEEK